MKTLRARVGQLSASQLSTIASLTGLQELMLQDAAIDDNTLINVVVNLPHLRRLTLQKRARGDRSSNHRTAQTTQR